MGIKPPFANKLQWHGNLDGLTPFAFLCHPFSDGLTPFANLCHPFGACLWCYGIGGGLYSAKAAGSHLGALPYSSVDFGLFLIG
jgi:hypothetical protein